MTKIKLSQSIKAKLRGSSPGRSEGSLHNRDYFIAFFGRAKGRRRKKLCTIVSGAPHSLRACFHYLRKNVKITPVLHATLALEQKRRDSVQKRLAVTSHSAFSIPCCSPSTELSDFGKPARSRMEGRMLFSS